MLPEAKYPRAYKYLQSLPEGLASYPECQARTEARDDIRRAYPELGADESLPQTIKDFFSGRYREPWISEVVSNTLQLMVRDVYFESDDDFLAWCYQGHLKLYKKPHLRLITFVISTTLLIMGATKRWGSFHRGSTLKPSSVEKSAGCCTSQINLEYPSRLFNRLMIEVHLGAYRAALEVTKAKNPRLRIVAQSDVSYQLALSWDA